MLVRFSAQKLAAHKWKNSRSTPRAVCSIADHLTTMYCLLSAKFSIAVSVADIYKLPNTQTQLFG